MLQINKSSVFIQDIGKNLGPVNVFCAEYNGSTFKNAMSVHNKWHSYRAQIHSEKPLEQLAQIERTVSVEELSG